MSLALSEVDVGPIEILGTDESAEQDSKAGPKISKACDPMMPFVGEETVERIGAIQ